MSETDRIIANVNATMAMEGMPLTAADKQRVKDCIEGEKSFDDTVEKLVEHYKKTTLITGIAMSTNGIALIAIQIPMF